MLCLSVKKSRTSRLRRIDACINLPALWIEFIEKHLLQVEQHGKDWLTARIKEADKAYETHRTALKKHQAQFQQNERQIGPAKQKYDASRKTTTQKLELELKQKDTAMANAKKQEDAVCEVVKDIEDEIDKEPKQAQKTIIRKTKDLKLKKDALEGAEGSFIEATKARNLKDREIHLLWPQAVDALIVNVKADQDQLAVYKAAIAKIKISEPTRSIHGTEKYTRKRNT